MQIESCKLQIANWRRGTIEELSSLSVENAAQLFRRMKFKGREALIARDILPGIRERLKFLCEVGLGYLQLGRGVPTLSGGESQRIRLAAQLGSNLSGVLYILDEPTTGLHFADVHKLLDVLQRLVSLGNTVIVIEHNLDVIKSADYIVDLGPEGGEHGGRVVAVGTPEEVARSRRSHTGHALRPLLNGRLTRNGVGS